MLSTPKTIGLWILQALMALVMVGPGVQKFTSPVWQRMFRVWGYPEHFYAVIGAIEVIAGAQRHMVRDTMGRLERELDPDVFVRIHRSTIVRIDAIKELVPDFHGDFTVVLKSGARLTLSRTYRAKVEGILGRAF